MPQRQRETIEVRSVELYYSISQPALCILVVVRAVTESRAPGVLDYACAAIAITMFLGLIAAVAMKLSTARRIGYVAAFTGLSFCVEQWTVQRTESISVFLLAAFSVGIAIWFATRRLPFLDPRDDVDSA